MPSLSFSFTYVSHYLESENKNGFHQWLHQGEIQTTLLHGMCPEMIDSPMIMVEECIAVQLYVADESTLSFLSL